MYHCDKEKKLHSLRRNLTMIEILLSKMCLLQSMNQIIAYVSIGADNWVMDIVNVTLKNKCFKDQIGRAHV